MFELSNLEKNQIRNRMIQDFELSFHKLRFFEKSNNLFHWKGEIEFPEMFEFLIRAYGSIGYSIKEKKWYVGYSDGKTDDLNRPIKYIGHDLSTNKTSKNFEIGKDFIVCWNNAMRLSDLPMIEFYSDLSKEGDISLKILIRNTRATLLLAASDDNLKEEAEAALRKVYAGDPSIITTDVFQQIEKLDILDPSQVDKLQYLAGFYENITKRFYTEFGVQISNKEKQAQITKEEIHQEEDLNTLNFLSYYESRLKFVKEMKEAGIQIECIPSPIYATEPKEEEIEDPSKMEEKEESENEKD